MLLRKSENSLEKKKQFHWRIFFQASGNSVRKRKAYKMKVVIQAPAIKCYHEFHLHKDLEMLIFGGFLLTKLIL